MILMEQLKSELSDLLRKLPEAIDLIYGSDKLVSETVEGLDKTGTLLWQEVMKLHDYAVLGELSETEHPGLWRFAEFLVGLPAVGSVLDFVGCEIPHTVIKVVRIGSARKVLDGETRLIPAEPGVGSDMLTLNEIAFLAGMDVRSVRNIVKVGSGPQTDDETLVAVHEGKRTLVPVAHARKWLGRRKDFRETRPSETSTAPGPVQLGAATLAALAAAARQAHLSPDEWVNRQIGKVGQR